MILLENVNIDYWNLQYVLYYSVRPSSMREIKRFETQFAALQSVLDILTQRGEAQLFLRSRDYWKWGEECLQIKAIKNVDS